MTKNQAKLGGKNSGSQRTTSLRFCLLCPSSPATGSPPYFKDLQVLSTKPETVLIQRPSARLIQTHNMIRLPMRMPTSTGCHPPAARRPRQTASPSDRLQESEGNDSMRRQLLISYMLIRWANTSARDLTTSCNSEKEDSGAWKMKPN